MAYDLDAAIREETAEPFTFTLGGKEFTIPHMQDVDKAALYIADSAGGQDVLDALKLALGEQWAAFDKLPLSVSGVNKLYEAWLEHSGLKSGESQASSPS